MFTIRVGFTYGWIAKGLLAIRRMEDPLERTGLRRFVLLLLGGFAAYDLAVRNVTIVVGVDTPDVVIGLVSVGANYPSLLWLRRFLHNRALARPAEPLPANLKSDLVATGCSKSSLPLPGRRYARAHLELGSGIWICVRLRERAWTWLVTARGRSRCWRF